MISTTALSFVFYYPDDEMLIRAKKLATNFTLSYFYFNFSSDIQSLEIAGNTIVVLNGDENHGLANPLNYIREKAFNNGAKWLIYLDQDFIIEQEEVRKYIATIESLKDDPGISAFGLSYENAAGKITLPPGIMTAQHLNLAGSVFNLNLRKDLPLDENLFLDGLDYDHSLLSHKLGYRLIKISGIEFSHQPGYKLKSLNYNDSAILLHEPVRFYYMVRNYFYLNKKYKDIFLLRRHRKNMLIWRIKQNLIFNSKKLAILKYGLLGYLHFLQNRLGKL